MGLAHRVFQVQEVKFASERFGLSDFNIPPGMCLKPSKIRVDIHYLFPQLVVYRISSAINSRTLVPQFFANHISLWGLKLINPKFSKFPGVFWGANRRWNSGGQAKGTYCEVSVGGSIEVMEVEGRNPGFAYCNYGSLSYDLQDSHEIFTRFLHARISDPTQIDPN